MFIGVRWALSGFGKKELKKGEDENLGSLSLYVL
jgi:hypothetical protein